MTPRAKKYKALLAAFIIVILVAAPQAQQPPPPGFATSGAVTAPPPPPIVEATDIDLLVGRSTILNVGTPITRVSLTVPDVADAMVTAPTQLLIHGKTPGTISMFVWDRSGAIKTYEVNVRRDLTELVAYLKQLFPGEDIAVIGSGKDVVISGTVASKYVVEKAGDVAAGYVEKKENVVNLLKQQEGVASNQVMLRVRFAEVSRTAMQELGASLFTGPGGFHDYVARTTTQQFSAPDFEEMTRGSIQGPDNWGGGRDTVTDTGGKSTFSDFLNLFLFNNKYNIGTVIKALSEKGLFQSLAEPNLIATNGKEASFLAGGEFPYPVVQGGGANSAVTIQFKEFGVRLTFTPTVLGGDLINLKVRPEVSSLDFANGVTVEGFRVPALSTRRTDTEVELRDGQTFAIAGLLNNTVTNTMRKIPGIGDIPILGWLFKSKALQKNQTELVVMITPTIIRRGQMGVSEGLPSLVEPYLGRPDKVVPNPDAYVGSPRYPVDPGTARPAGSAEAPPAADAPAAANVPAVARPVAPVNMHPAATSAAAPAEKTPAVKAAPAKTEKAPAPAAKAPAARSAAAPVAPPAPRLTKDQLKALERQREANKKADEAAAKKRREDEKRKAEEAEKAAEQAEKDRKAAAEQAEKDRKAAEKLEKERAEREAEVAKRNAEIAQKQAEEDLKRDRALAEAAERLKAAQAAYQEEIEKAKGGSNEKPKGSGGGTRP